MSPLQLEKCMNITLPVEKGQHFCMAQSRSWLPLAEEYDQPKVIQTWVGIVCPSQYLPYIMGLLKLMQILSCKRKCRMIQRMLSTPSCGGVALAQSSLPIYHIGGYPLSDCNKSALVLGMLHCAFYSMWLMRNARYCQVALLCDWLVEYVWACRRGRIV